MKAAKEPSEVCDVVALLDRSAAVDSSEQKQTKDADEVAPTPPQPRRRVAPAESSSLLCRSTSRNRSRRKRVGCAWRTAVRRILRAGLTTASRASVSV